MSYSNQLLSNQTAIVTGGSSGIGKGCAIALGKAGANVVVNYAGNAKGAEETLDEIKSTGGNGMIFKADVSKQAQVQAMFQASIEQFGTVDILVSNAGIQKDSAFVDMTLDQWQRVIDVNLTGQFLCAQEATREFIRRGPRPDVSKSLGKIICMSSVHEFIPWAGHVNYAASKGGLMLFMKSIAQELGELGIRVNSIAPGAIKTPINQSVWSDPESAKELVKLIPYGRLGETEDIGNLAVWLASDLSDYIHGQTITMDGGMALYPGFIGNG